jgi:hypothetical protein
MTTSPRTLPASGIRRLMSRDMSEDAGYDKMINEIFGLLPGSDGWVLWFAWRPVFACGRWRWFRFVQRRRDHPAAYRQVFRKYDRMHPRRWKYTAGMSHDYVDGTMDEPLHFYTYTCKHCSARFSI